MSIVALCVGTICCSQVSLIWKHMDMTLLVKVFQLKPERTFQNATSLAQALGCPPLLLERRLNCLLWSPKPHVVWHSPLPAHWPEVRLPPEPTCSLLCQPLIQKMTFCASFRFQDSCSWEACLKLFPRLRPSFFLLLMSLVEGEMTWKRCYSQT